MLYKFSSPSNRQPMLPTIAIWLTGTLVVRSWDKEDLEAAVFGLQVEQSLNMYFPNTKFNI